MRFIIALCALLPTCIATISADLAPPPPFVIISEPHSNFFARINTQNKHFEIYDLTTMKVTWSVTLETYDDYYSIIQLSPNGKHLVHIYGNDIVGANEHVCAEVHSADPNDRIIYRLDEFTENLPQKNPDYREMCPPPPEFLWAKEILRIDNNHARVWTIENQFIFFDLSTHNIMVRNNDQ